MQRIREKAAKSIIDTLDRAAAKNPNADMTDDEVERFVNEAIHESRSQKS